MHNRRQFLEGVAAASAGAVAALAVRSMADEKVSAVETVPIVDTHQHLWDLDKFKLPWTKDVAALNKSFLLRDYWKAAEGLNVVQTVYMEVDVDPSQQTEEAQYVVELCKQPDSHMAAAVVSGRPASPSFGAYLDQFKDRPQIKGVRQVLHTPATPQGHCLQKEFIAGIRLLGKRGLSYDLCMRPGELRDACKLIDECPDTRFILDHCGNPNPQSKDLSQWKKDLAAVAKRQGIMCKVSGLVDKLVDKLADQAGEKWSPDDLAPVVHHALEVFGPDRVMFGGDWPVCTLRVSLRQWVQALQQIVAGRPLAEQRKLFHDNAVKFYGLA